MATGRRASDSAQDEGRSELTLTERARREQLVQVTIELVADHGYAGTSLAAIARAAGITKAAVLYHFPAKDLLVRAAYERVLQALVGDVAAAVDAVDVAQGPAAYIRAMIGHLHEHPRHTRMIVEAMVNDQGDDDPAARWQPLAQIIAAADEARGTAAREARARAIIVGGAIDAIVAERLRDPGFDTMGAAEHLVRLIESGPAKSIPVESAG